MSQDPLGYFAGSNLYEYAGDSPADRADPLGLWTVSIGVSVNGMWGPGGVGGSAGIVIDGSGNVAVYTTKGGGVGAGEKASGGLSIGSSNAATVGGIAGPFAQVSVGAAGGASVSGDFYTGSSPDGMYQVGGWNGNIGVGLGGGGMAGVTTTQVYPPFLNITDVWNGITSFFGGGSGRPSGGNGSGTNSGPGASTNGTGISTCSGTMSLSGAGTRSI